MGAAVLVGPVVALGHRGVRGGRAQAAWVVIHLSGLGLMSPSRRTRLCGKSNTPADGQAAIALASLVARLAGCTGIGTNAGLRARRAAHHQRPALCGAAARLF